MLQGPAMFQTLPLIFGDEKRLINKTQNRLICIHEERNNFINVVNHVIRQHKNTSIEEFKIQFQLDRYSKGAINKWIKFAISKQVQTLELDLRDVWYLENYFFPYKIFDKRSYRSSLKFLKALILKDVNVNDEGIMQVLSSCPVLEPVYIYGSRNLVFPKIGGKCHALKNFEIVCCNVESVEIRDSNIVSFSWVGPRLVTLKFHNLQKLEKISIGETGSSSWMENKLWPQISCCIDYLQVLQLDLCKPVLLRLPELPKLKHLILKFDLHEDMDGALVMTSLVEACPNLRRFTIQLRWELPIFKIWEVRPVAKHAHQHLEVVETCGYSGRTIDLELAIYFIENCVALKKLVIYPRHKAMARETIATECAKRELEPRRPHGVDCRILACRNNNLINSI